MSSKSISIYDMGESIRNNLIPGAFNDEKTEYIFPTVVTTTSTGATRFWTIKVKLLDEMGNVVIIEDNLLNQPVIQLDGFKGELNVESGQENGKIRKTVPTLVLVGKNLKKRNATNVITQALRDALGQYNKQKKRASGSASTSTSASASETKSAKKEECKISCTNDENFNRHDERPPPMLVNKIGATKASVLTDSVFQSGITLQYKLNGVRLVSRLNQSHNELYSRTRSEYLGLDAIRIDLQNIITNAPPLPDRFFKYGRGNFDQGAKDSYLPQEVYLDGELYIHGKPLQYISGQARKPNDEGELQYYIFDCFFPRAKSLGFDMKSEFRQQYLDMLFGKRVYNTLHRVENFIVSNMDEVNEHSRKALSENYEGVILRKDNAGYCYSYNNYHSSNILKMKPLFDDEFSIVGYTQGRRGKDVGAVVWICEISKKYAKDIDDRRFNVVPKDMSYEQRYLVFRCLGEMVDNKTTEIKRGAPLKISRFDRDFKGKPMTVEYRELSKLNKPQQAKAVTVRTYENNNQNDPLKKLFIECGTGNKK